MSRKVVFTTCTASYLAQARSLGESLLATNPGYQLCIGLVDRLDGRFDPAALAPHIITEVEQIGVPRFDDMKLRYSLLELSCALKPWFALYFMQQQEVNEIIYLDTDIRVLHPLRYIEDGLARRSVLLTPHILSPFPADGKRPHETAILKTGIYNAGFFAVKGDENGMAFLNWWKDILVDYCYEDGKRGLASDQSWLNFVPLFFENVEVIWHPGCNVAYWNLHERKIEKNAEGYLVNNEFPLLFFHFSGYSLEQPGLISRHQDRFSMDDNSAVRGLFDQYRQALVQFNHEQFRQMRSVYSPKKGFLRKLGFK